jgi:hypothetical protein
MHRVFISHRREDAAGSVDRLCDWLKRQFGAANVFLDTDKIASGETFTLVLEERLAASDVLLAVIGPRWVSISDAAGNRRIADPKDFVVLEVATALKLGIRVIPVLVGGAPMPTVDQLPAALQGLDKLQATVIDDSRFPQDFDNLVDAIVGRARDFARRELGRAGSIERLNLGARIRSGWRMLMRALPLKPVLLGASVPASARPGEEFSARFVAYVAEEEEEVLETLHRLSPRATSHSQIKRCYWRVGTRVHVTLSGKWLHVSNPVQEFVWQASWVLLDFDVQVADDAPEGTTLLKLDVVIDGFVVAPIRIDLGVGTSVRQGGVHTAITEAAQTAFASYAATDRARVLDRVAAVKISAGLDVFLDCLSLHPGEAWKPRLAEEIRDRDVFLLFWTAAAASSEWVTWEWQTALAAKGKNGLQVHPMESGIAPPEQLKDLHFGDVMMLIRDASAHGL